MTATNSIPDRVSSLELFFDLVFVFTITQVAEVVVHHPTPSGVGHAVLVLSVLLWMFGGFAWLTNASGPATTSRRILLLAGMAAFFVCALSVPHAFDDDGVTFGIAYLLVNIVHTAGLLIDSGRTPIDAVKRLAPFNMTSATLVLAAGFVTGPMDWVLWSAAILVQMATPFLGRVSEKGFIINPTHFAERHGLMILIVLGESLVSVGLAATASEPRVGPALILGALAGLAASAAMWWAYFAGEDEKAARAHEHSPARQRALQGVIGFGLAHLLMIFGAVAIAAATKIALRELLSPMPPFGAWLMAAGCALYLIGGSVFRISLGHGSPNARFAGAAVSAVVVPAGLFGSPAAALAAVAIVIFGTVAVECSTD